MGCNFASLCAACYWQDLQTDNVNVSSSGYLLPTDSKKELPCKKGYSGSVSAECTLDGKWEVSGTCGGGGGESRLKRVACFAAMLIHAEECLRPCKGLIRNYNLLFSIALLNFPAWVPDLNSNVAPSASKPMLLHTHRFFPNLRLLQALFALSATLFLAPTCKHSIPIHSINSSHAFTCLIFAEVCQYSEVEWPQGVDVPSGTLQPGQEKELSCKNGYKGGLLASCNEDGNMGYSSPEERGLPGCYKREWNIKIL